MMKALLLPVVLLLNTLIYTTTADTSDTFPAHVAINDPKDGDDFQGLFNASIAAVGADPPTDDEVWKKAQCKGENLNIAMTLDEDGPNSVLNKMPYIQSPWDGTMEDDRHKWGYSEGGEKEEKKCEQDLADLKDINTALKALSTDYTSAKNGWPNHCYNARHRDSPNIHLVDGKKPSRVSKQWFTVDGKEYRSTGAHAVIATNPTAGLVTFIDLLSPPKAAVQYWKVDPVDSAELPELRSMSDIAWGFWNRVASPDKLGSIKYFIFTAVSNPELKNVIIPRALKIMNAEDGKHQAWPGTAFRVGSAAASKEEKEAAEALVGSPNDVAAAYFLIQHKKQLGLKYISKIRIFRGGDTGGPPELVYYVESDPPPYPPKKEEPKPQRRDDAQNVESRIVARSKDGFSLAREHVFRARL